MLHTAYWGRNFFAFCARATYFCNICLKSGSIKRVSYITDKTHYDNYDYCKKCIHTIDGVGSHIDCATSFCCYTASSISQ